MNKPTTSEATMRSTHITIDGQLADRSEAQAKLEDISFSQLVRKALRKYLTAAATPTTP